jgi:hypothetical protein
MFSNMDIRIHVISQPGNGSVRVMWMYARSLTIAYDAGVGHDHVTTHSHAE